MLKIALLLGRQNNKVPRKKKGTNALPLFLLPPQQKPCYQHLTLGFCNHYDQGISGNNEHKGKERVSLL